MIDEEDALKKEEVLDAFEASLLGPQLNSYNSK